MEPALTDDVPGRWSRFARNEAQHHSAVMVAWAEGVAADPQLCELIASLPPRERQPNLVLAAARVVAPDLVDPHQTDARPDEYERLRTVLLDHWPEVAAITATRHTQTNEPARLAAVLPALHTLARRTGRELALIEVGASAGLALHPSSWTFRYTSRDGAVLSEFGAANITTPSQPTPSDPAPSQPAPVIHVTVKDDPDAPPIELPTAVPPIMWRLGLDLNPLDPTNDAVASWLRTLVWPGQSARLARLDAAIAAARDDRVLVLRHDLTDPTAIDEVLRLVPRDYLPVVMHGAVLAYLDEPAREAFAADMMARVASGHLHWLSNEGQQVNPTVWRHLEDDPDFRSRLRKGSFIVSLDGRPLYQADGHATWLL
ncbi:DUF2332 family protein [Propionibacteriaceae bacterium G1746]|uniref:DUF2332 family protein n=1 Tax=Aestuariimicrobium sp. G57 TaxID=3418485 RepID=UPI003C1DA210